MSDSGTGRASGLNRPLAVLVAGAYFMENLDGTIIATALPQMAHSFGVGPNSLSLGMTAYMLALAIFIPASGWVADRCGSRTVFFSAIGVFRIAETRKTTTPMRIRCLVFIADESPKFGR